MTTDERINTRISELREAIVELQERKTIVENEAENEISTVQSTKATELIKLDEEIAAREFLISEFESVLVVSESVVEPEPEASVPEESDSEEATDPE